MVQDHFTSNVRLDPRFDPQHDRKAKAKDEFNAKGK